MPVFAPSLEALRASVFAELAPALAARKRAGLSTAPLHIGDTWRTPDLSTQALPAWATGHSANLYATLGGETPLRDALARRFTARHGVATARDEVLATVGATHGLLTTLRACVEAGSEVIVLAPYWPLSVGVVRAAGALPVEVPFADVLDDEGVAAALAGVVRAITHRTRAIYFASPNNPCGTTFSADVLGQLLALARAHDLWVIADEVYAELVYDGGFVSIASLDGAAERTVVLRSFSKSHGLAGIRLGWLRARAEIVSEIAKVATHSVFHPTVHAQGVGLVALGSDAWQTETFAMFRAARDKTLARVRAAGLRALAPSGGYYVFFDATPLLGGAPVEGLLRRALDAGVMLCPGRASGAAYARWVRLCFTAVDPAALDDALERLAPVLSP